MVTMAWVRSSPPWSTRCWSTTPSDIRRIIPNYRTARGSIEKLLAIKDDEAYCQPCLSPVWDTALSAHALMEVGGTQAEASSDRALEWLKPLQVLDTVGDWGRDETEHPARRLGVSIRKRPLLPTPTIPPSSSWRWTVRLDAPAA